MRLLVFCMTVLLLITACGGSTETVDGAESEEAASEPATSAPATEVPATAVPATVTPAEAVDDEAAGDDAPTADDSVDVPEADAPDAEDPDPGDGTADTDGLFPTVVDAQAQTADGVIWNVAVTLSSEYDSRDRYADAWRVLDADDKELGIRVLTHDHANEQPFTRSHSIEIPADLDTVFIEGRDQLNGWSGERFVLTLGR